MHKEKQAKQTKKSKKVKKKHRRKKGQQPESESEEDIPAEHVVTTELEAPDVSQSSRVM